MSKTVDSFAQIADLKLRVHRLQSHDLRRLIREVTAIKDLDECKYPELKRSAEYCLRPDFALTEENIKLLMAMFREHNSLKKDGQIRDCLGEDTPFMRYALANIGQDEIQFRQFLNETFYALFLVAESEDSERREDFFAIFPPSADFLQCLAGTRSRISASLQKLQSDEGSSLLLDAHNFATSKIIELLSPFVYKGNHVHLLAYLEYVLSLKTREELTQKEPMFFNPNFEVPSALLIKALQEYSEKTKEYISRFLRVGKLDIEDEISFFWKKVARNNNLPDKFFEREILLYKEGIDGNVISDHSQQVLTNINLAIEEFKELFLLGPDFEIREFNHENYGQKIKFAEIIDNIFARKLAKLSDKISLVDPRLAEGEEMKSAYSSDARSTDDESLASYFKDESVNLIFRKLNSENPQELLQGLEILFSFGRRCYGGAQLQFIKIFEKFQDPRSLINLERRVKKLLPDHLWKLNEIIDFYNTTKPYVSEYEGLAASRNSLIHDICLNNTDRAINIITLVSRFTPNAEILTRAHVNQYFGHLTNYNAICESILSRGDIIKIFTNLNKCNVSVDFLSRALLFAAKTNNHQLLGLVFNSLASKDRAGMLQAMLSEDIREDIFIENSQKDTPLNIAIGRGHEELATSILEFCKHFNIVDEVANPPHLPHHARQTNSLYFAVETNCQLFVRNAFEILERDEAILLMSKARADCLENGYTSLHFATARGNHKMTELLLNAEEKLGTAPESLKIRHNNGKDSLAFAIESGSVATVQCVLKSMRENLVLKDMFTGVPSISSLVGNYLHAAALSNSLEIFKMILDEFSLLKLSSSALFSTSNPAF